MLMGGPKLLTNTVQSLFGIKIDRYVMLDHRSLEALLDTTGSVMTKLDEAQSETINMYIDDEELKVSPGSEYINGRQLIRLARYAGAPNDGTTSKLRGELLFDTACNLNDASSLKLIMAFSRAAQGCHTDLAKGQLFSMSSMIFELKGSDVLTDAIPADSEYTLVSIGGRTIMRLTDTAFCRERLVRTAMGIEAPAHENVPDVSGTDTVSDADAEPHEETEG